MYEISGPNSVSVSGISGAVMSDSLPSVIELCESPLFPDSPEDAQADTQMSQIETQPETQTLDPDYQDHNTQQAEAEPELETFESSQFPTEPMFSAGESQAWDPPAPPTEFEIEDFGMVQVINQLPEPPREATTDTPILTLPSQQARLSTSATMTLAFELYEDRTASYSWLKWSKIVEEWGLEKAVFLLHDRFQFTFRSFFCSVLSFSQLFAFSEAMFYSRRTS